ncbi:MAG: hypothetical protein ACOC2Q_03540, partial [Spirochaetota bacterium]
MTMLTFGRKQVIGAVLVLVSLLLVTCDNFSLSGAFYRDTGLPLTLYPANAATWASDTLEFVGQGGAPEYTFRVEDADGGTIDAETGEYTAPPHAGEFVVTVTDRAGTSRPAVVYVVDQRPLRISPRSASVALGADPPDHIDFTASGGEGEYEFSDEIKGGVIPREYIPAVGKGA